MNRKNILYFTLCLLVACGSGGDSEDSQTVVPGPLPDLILASAITDVNNDGINDLIISSQGESKSAPQVFINSGDGQSFTELKGAIPPQYKGQLGGSIAITPTDINNDNNMDLVISTVELSDVTIYQSNEIQLFIGSGDGTFSDATSDITTSTIEEVNQLFSTLFDWFGAIEVLDFDGDGFLDIAAVSNGSTVIYKNDTTGKFAPAELTVNEIGNATQLTHVMPGSIIGDINGDLKPDFIQPTSWLVYLNSSTPGNFSFDIINNWHTNNFEGGLHRGALIDINDDTYLDLVATLGITSSSDKVDPVYAFEGDGSGGFVLNDALLAQQPTLHHARGFIVEDFNVDGFDDLFIVDHGWDYYPFPGAQNWLLYGNGTKLEDVSASNLSVQAGFTHQATTGDLNGDGAADIFMNNKANCSGQSLECSEEPRFWMNDGTGVFSSYSPMIE